MRSDPAYALFLAVCIDDQDDGLLLIATGERSVTIAARAHASVTGHSCEVLGAEPIRYVIGEAWRGRDPEADEPCLY